MSKIKIAICVHNLSNGGAERVAVLWAEGFAADGNEVHVITCEPMQRIDYEMSKSINHHSIYSEGNPLKRYFNKVWQLRQLMQALHPDVALAVLHPWNIWLLMATCGLGIPVINTEHDSFERPSSAPMSFGQKFDKFILNSFFRGVTVLTDVDKKIANKHIKRVFTLPNPLAFSPLTEIPIKKKIIMAAGRLDDWYCKGFDVLIEAWGGIAGNYPEWKLCIAGGGNKKNTEYLISMIKKKGLENNVNLLGFRKDIVQIFKESEIFVLSSRYEGFGLVLIEAMSQGCACVACDYKGRQREIVDDGKSGLWCDVNDALSLSERMRELLDNSKYRCSIQKEAINRSRYFEIGKTLERWDSIFQILKIQ